MAILGQIGDVDIRLIKIFRTVVECGGFSAASLELDISDSVLSRQMKDLEARLGVVLCRRGRAGFAISEEGEQVYRASEKLLAALEQFRLEVNDSQSTLRGNLVVGIFDHIIGNPKAHLDHAFHLFDIEAPQVHLELHIEPVNQIEQNILNGRFDIAISAEHVSSPRLDYRFLFTEQMYLYCGCEHSLFDKRNLRETDIVNSKFVGLGYHSPNMIVSEEFRLTKDAVVYDQEAVGHLILSNRYLGFLPDHYADQWVRQKRMKALIPKRFHYQPNYVAIWQKNQLSPTLNAFLNALITAHPDQDSASIR